MLGQPLVSTAAISHTGQPTGAGFDLLLLFHGACALVGIGAVVVSGTQAWRLGALPAGSEAPVSLRRYYTPGFNWAARVLYGVPVFGFALLGASKGAYGLGQGWVMIGLTLWVVVIGLGEGLLWPLERRLQEAVSRSAGGERGTGVASTCRSAWLTASAMLLLLVVAMAIMFARP